MNQPLLSICITTYKRPEITCDLLSKLYFDRRIEYLLVDDGSLHEQVQAIHDFIVTHNLDVTFLTKPNGGKLSALLMGLKHAKGTYFTDLDSDDVMEKSHVLNILDGIRQADEQKARGTEIAGICGLSETPDGNVFGDIFPVKLEIGSYIQMRLDHKVWGNKVEVILTEVLRGISVDLVAGENRMATNVLWFSLNDLPILFMNIPFEIYSPDRTDSISNNLRFIQTRSPNSSRNYFKVILQKKKYYNRISPYLVALVNYQRFSWHGAKPFFESALSKKETFLLILVMPLSFTLYCWDIFLLKKRRNQC